MKIIINIPIYPIRTVSCEKIVSFHYAFFCCPRVGIGGYTMPEKIETLLLEKGIISPLPEV